MSIALEPETETRLPDRYEVVDGNIVKLPPISVFSSEVANQIRDKLAAYCETHRIGRTRNDMLFQVPLKKDRGRNRRLVYPRSRTLHAYDSVSSVHVFNIADVLNGGSLLPSFQVPMSQLFPPMIPEPESSQSDDDE